MKLMLTLLEFYLPRWISLIMQLTKQQEIFIVTQYSRNKSLQHIRQVFELQFPERAPPTNHIILKPCRKFQDKGNILNLNTENSGRIKTARTPENINRINEMLIENPTVSTRRNETRLSKLVPVQNWTSPRTFRNWLSSPCHICTIVSWKRRTLQGEFGCRGWNCHLFKLFSKQNTSTVSMHLKLMYHRIIFSNEVWIEKNYHWQWFDCRTIIFWK